MFITLQRMNKHGINKVRGGPFSWVRNYNYRERIVIQYFIDEMKQGWINFLRCYNTFKIFWRVPTLSLVRQNVPLKNSKKNSNMNFDFIF